MKMTQKRKKIVFNKRHSKALDRALLNPIETNRMNRRGNELFFTVCLTAGLFLPGSIGCSTHTQISNEDKSDSNGAISVLEQGNDEQETIENMEGSDNSEKNDEYTKFEDIEVVSILDTSSVIDTPYTFIKDIDEIDPDTIPLVVENFYVANTKDGRIRIYDENGNRVDDNEYDSLYIRFFEPTTLVGKVDETEESYYVAGSNSVFLGVDGPSGFGGHISEFYTYSPEEDCVNYYQNESAESRPASIDTFKSLSANYFMVIYDDKDHKPYDLTRIIPYYAWNLRTNKVYGPFNGSEVYGYNPKNYNIENSDTFTKAYDTIIPVLEGSKYSLIYGEKKTNPIFSDAEAVGFSSVFAVDDEQKYSIGPTLEEIKLLPETAQLSSAKTEYSIMILEDGVWKLYADETEKEKIQTQEEMKWPQKMELDYNMNLRSLPINWGDNIIGTLPKGSNVDVYRIINGLNSVWGEINRKGSGEWICIQYFSDTYLHIIDPE